MTTKKAKVQTITLDKKAAEKAKFRGARAAWLEALIAYDGKPLAEFVAHVEANPPSTPRTGKYAGQCEPPMGWVRFFVRQEILTVVAK